MAHFKSTSVENWETLALKERRKDTPEQMNHPTLEGIELKFTEKALREIVKLSQKRKTGARGLRSILEKVMVDVMFKVPSMNNVKECLITEDVIFGNAEPVLKMGKSRQSA